MTKEQADENLALRAEIAAVKARLAEAEAWWQGKVEEQRQGKYAAERERDGYAKHLEDTGKRWVAAVEAWQRKCAELSEALRSTIRTEWDDNAGMEFWTCCGIQVKGEHDCKVTAALASQPAPEGKSCVCPNPALHAELAAPNHIDPSKCYKPTPEAP